MSVSVALFDHAATSGKAQAGLLVDCYMYYQNRNATNLVLATAESSTRSVVVRPCRINQLGDMADLALSEMLDYDGICTDEPNPFCHEPGPSGPGLCPLCGNCTHLTTGKYGAFWGCDAYPKCKGSRSYA